LLGVDFDRLREVQAALNLVRLELVNSHVMRRRAVRIRPLFYPPWQRIDRKMSRRPTDSNHCCMRLRTE
jgi:hypothetical protein